MSNLAVRNAGLLWKMAHRLLESGFLPKALNTPAKAFAVIQAGHELGIAPMQAMRSLHVIDGKVGMASELMLALCYRTIQGFAFEMLESDKEVARARARRNPQDAWFELKMTREEIPSQVKAKGPWKDYAAAMLRARLTAAICRVKGPDAIAGMHTPDELGAVTAIHDDGTEEIVLPRLRSGETVDEDTGKVIEDNGGGADRLAQSEQGNSVISVSSGATDSTAAPVETETVYTNEEYGKRITARLEELQHPAAVIAWAKKHAEEIKMRGHHFQQWARAKVDLRIVELKEQIRAGYREDIDGPK